MRKILLGFTLGVLLLIGGGAIAYANDWLSFTGDNQIIQSGDDVDEIMEILRKVNEDKLTAKEALAKLEETNPPGLAKKNKELREEIEQLKNEKAVLVTDNNAKDKVAEENSTIIEQLHTERDDLQTKLDNAADSEEVEHLRKELQKANEQVKNHHNTTQSAVEEARTYIGESK